MRRLPFLLLVLVFLAPCARAEDATPAYTRTLSEDGHVALEIAARELVPAEGKGPRVWLVGVIHIADASYYEAVQATLDLHPVVLYESVMPPGLGRLRKDSAEVRVEDTRTRLAFLARVLRGLDDAPEDYAALVDEAARRDPRLGHFLARARDDAWGHEIAYATAGAGWRLASLGADGVDGGDGEAADLVITSEDRVEEPKGMNRAPFNLQEKFAKLLKLAYQGGSIDYGREGWQPSDMGIDEVRRAVKARGGEFGTVEEVLAGRGLTGAFVRLYMGILKAADVLSGGRVVTMVKTMLVQKLGAEGAEPRPNAFLDAAVLGAIIQDRNAVVVEDLKRLVASRPRLPSVAIFYGAGHMPDFQRRLTDLGYTPGRVRWLRALDVETQD